MEFKSSITQNVLKNVELDKGLSLLEEKTSLFSGNFESVYGANYDKDFEKIKYFSDIERNLIYGTPIERLLSKLGLKGGRNKLDDRIRVCEVTLAELAGIADKYKNLMDELNSRYFDRKREIINCGAKIEGLEESIQHLEKERNNIKEDLQSAIVGNSYKDKVAKIDLEEQLQYLAEDVDNLRQQQKMHAYKIGFADKEIKTYEIYRERVKAIFDTSQKALTCGKEYLKFVQDNKPYFCGMLEAIDKNYQAQKSLHSLKSLVDEIEHAIDQQAKIYGNYAGKNPAENLIAEKKSNGKKMTMPDDGSLVDNALKIYHNL